MENYENYSEWDQQGWDRERDLSDRDFSGPILFSLGALFGAGLMYVLDPDRGRRRRALVRDKISRGSRQVGEFADRRTRDFANRMKGAVQEGRARIRDREGVDDATLAERVRAQLGHVVSHPGSVEVLVTDGRVILRGPVLRGEIANIRERLDKTRGVSDYSIELKEYDRSSNIPGLQGESRPPREGIA
jgi:hypothetical protein